MNAFIETRDWPMERKNQFSESVEVPNLVTDLPVAAIVLSKNVKLWYSDPELVAWMESCRLYNVNWMKPNFKKTFW